MWAEYTSSIEQTTNCCESFHSEFNSSSIPNIYQQGRYKDIFGVSEIRLKMNKLF